MTFESLSSIVRWSIFCAPMAKRCQRDAGQVVSWRHGLKRIRRLQPCDVLVPGWRKRIDNFFMWPPEMSAAEARRHAVKVLREVAAEAAAAAAAKAAEDDEFFSLALGGIDDEEPECPDTQPLFEDCEL